MKTGGHHGPGTIKTGDRCPVQVYNSIDMTRCVNVNGTELSLRACFSEGFVDYAPPDPGNHGRMVLVFTEKAAAHNSRRF